MAPPDLEHVINGTATLEISGLEAKKSSPKLEGGGDDIPVQSYENENQVPDEFLIKNPKDVPTRIWGQYDPSEPQNNALPVIDMSPLINQATDPDGAKKVIQEIGKACEEWGYFQAYNHGISESLLVQVVEAVSEFFSLPLEEKNVYAVKPGGMEGYGRLAIRMPTRLWNDMMRHTIRPRLTPKEVEERMPAKPAQYRPLIEEYTQEVEKLLDVVWAALSVYLDLQTTTLREEQGSDGERIIVRMNYYPKCPEPEKVVGVSAHQDFGSLTVLVEDQVGGLQVAKPDTDNPVWLDVAPMKGSLLINIGKQIEHLTNGRLKAMMHRALANGKEKRTSVALFQIPGAECSIKPLPEMLEKSQEAPHFKQLRFGDYVKYFSADILANVNPHARYAIDQSAYLPHVGLVGQDK